MANWEDIHYNEKQIKSVNERLKHVGILISEIAKANIPDKASSSFKVGENLNTKLQRREFLSRQALITSKWISHAPLCKDRNVKKYGLMQRNSLIMNQEEEASPTQTDFMVSVPHQILDFEKLHSNHTSQISNIQMSIDPKFSLQKMSNPAENYMTVGNQTLN